MYLPPYSINGSEKLSDIVARDYRTADVFNSFRIDFYSNGDTTLQKVCKDNGLEISEVQSALLSSIRDIQLSNKLPFEDWKIDFLIDYIINVHHVYLRKKMPELQSLITQLQPGDVSEAFDVNSFKLAFDDIYSHVIPHLDNEENTVFPYLKQVTGAWYKKETYGALLIRTLRKPIEKTLLNEHEKLKELMQKLRKITHHYSTSKYGSIKYKILMKQLQEFDNDFVQHMYLETKILFPRVMVIEKELLSLNISA
jgi:regulator of cell morphogenesis and NO signaling